MHSLQAQELHDDQEQEEAPGQVGNQQILRGLPQAYPA
jgi:hypothetical protein